jgi:hypothetical protein
MKGLSADVAENTIVGCSPELVNAEPASAPVYPQPSILLDAYSSELDSAESAGPLSRGTHVKSKL